MNHVMYADDICLMAAVALQELIDICYDFSVQNDLSFIFSNMYCMVFKPYMALNCISCHVPDYIWTTNYCSILMRFHI